VGPDGEPIDWFCPSQEINFEAIERPMLEIVSNYGVDGIQYDFIRYPNQRGCFCDVCRKRFERESGAVVEHWPEDCLGEPNKGPRYDDGVRYRASRISALVERISTKIHAAHPDIKISAAVFRDWPDCVETSGQNWVHWCEQGWLDMVCPISKFERTESQFLVNAVSSARAEECDNLVAALVPRPDLILGLGTRYRAENDRLPKTHQPELLARTTH